MATACETIIKQDIGLDCENPIFKGVETRGVIINRRDIDFGGVVMADDNANVIKTLPLKSGKAYEIVQGGANPYTNTITEVVVGTYSNSVNNTVAFVVLDKGPEVSRNIIDGLLNGEFVVILEHKFKGAGKKGAFRVYGFHQGLKISAGSEDPNSEETLGGWSVTLQEVNAPKSGMYLFDTDYDTTLSKVESLISRENP